MEDDKKYGVPSQKKFPMPDAKHVRSAIKFFNYVDPSHEKELASAILKRMEEYGMSFNDFTVGEDNRFSNYIPDEFEHSGVLGMKWGVRRYQNEDGTLTELGKQRLRKDSSKLERLQNKTEKKQTKQATRAEKFVKRNESPFFRSKKSVKRSADKLRRANNDFSRAFNKATKFYKKMEKRYGNNLLTELDQGLLTKGQTYVAAAMNRSLNTVTAQQLSALSNALTDYTIRG